MAIDVFETNTAATSGLLDGQYLWSNGGNWSTQVTPANGGIVTLSASGVDDMSALNLAIVIESGGNDLHVAGASLAIGTIDTAANFQLYAGFLGDTTPVTVTVGSIVGSGGIYGAVGGTFIDLSTTDPGEHYFAGFGGSVTLHAAPVSTSILEFGGAYSDTIALESLAGGINGTTLAGLGVGDVLEVPGNAVTGVSFGASSLTITTNIGTTTFSNASYFNSVTGYIATHNGINGLEAITLTGPDIFSDNVAAGAGAGLLDGQYLWSNPSNWSLGTTPVSGGSVVLDATGIDDLGSISLTSLTDISGNDLHVAGASLAIGTLDVNASAQLYAGILGVTTPVTVSVNSIVGSGSILGAVGGTFIDLSTTDPGEHYFAGYGGSVTLHAAPSPGSVLEFGGAYADTIALETLPPGFYNAAPEGLGVGDVLELPGNAVESVSFGASSLTITTNLGTTTFEIASYYNSVTGYIATHNGINGLEAITLTGPDIFSDNVAAGAGAGLLDGQYLWSNPSNWSLGTTPVSGGSVVLDATGIDDLGSISLTSLTDIGGNDLHVAGASLAIGTLDVTASTQLYAGILGVSSPVTVSVSSIVGSGSILGAVGGTFIDLSTSDPGELYFAGYGGSVTLHAAPVSSSILEFGGFYTDTIALETLPIGVYSATLADLGVGDVLELPGSVVDSVSFGASSVTIVTNLGTTTFSNANYYNSVTGYIATHNNANGLENITLTGPDIFTGGIATTVGSIGVVELWSTPDNWQSGATPVSGGSVVLDADGVDDLGSISLTSITEEPGAELFYIAGSSLTVGTLAVNANDELYAGILGDATLATVSVASIVGSGSILGAVGGTFIDLSTSDPGEHYFAGYGGSVTLHAAPASTSILEFGGGYVDTIALESLPVGIQGVTLEGLGVGDVLELPGSVVDSVSFGTSSVTIVTNLGTTTFSNVSYYNSVTGYIATHNNANGLENITLTGPDIFTGGIATTVGSIGVIQLWSTPYNWQSGTTPVSGGSVVLDADGVDDLGSLSLTSITEEPGAELFYIAGASLTVGTLAVNANDELYAGILGDATLATVSVASIVGSGSILGAVGGTFIDLSTSDPGEHYFAGYGGSVTLHAAPASTSILEFGGGYVDTIALETLPTGIEGATLEGLGVGDVLELPGSVVDSVSFGASSVTIVTNLGTTTFSNANYYNSVTGYIATHNNANGLENITLTGPDIFTGGIATTVGSIGVIELWSTPYNWQSGATPVSGGSVVLDADGVDDLGSISLTSITEEPGAELFYIAGSSLTVGTLAVNANDQLYAGILGVTTPVTVSVSSIVGSGSILGAVGGTFIDLSTSDPGELYFAGYGGSVTLHAAPVSSSILEFGGGYTDTIALEGVASGTYSATVEGVQTGDVLELPGFGAAASFGATSFTITTSHGAFAFSNVDYGFAVNAETATYNAASGLEFVTFAFTGPETFAANIAASAGSLAGDYLWSNPANWSAGLVPSGGASIVLGAAGVDDLAAISLSSVTETGANNLYVAGSSLAIGTLDVAANFQLYAGDFGVSTPVSVTAGSIAGSGGILGAIGANAAFNDLATTDPGEHYLAAFGGTVTLHAAPARSSTLDLGGLLGGTIALENLAPGTYSALLEGIAPDDALELPGSAVTSVNRNGTSLTITTSAGVFDFSDVQYDGGVNGYTASHNAASGLELIQFEAACFAAGTRILTADGRLTAVEHLREGDALETYDGATAKIIWLGRRSLDLRRHPRPRNVQPILITAGALGHGLPWRDLVVSPDHGMYLNGHLIPAKALTNGFSIRQLNRDAVTYFHIELPQHAVIFAEGAGAESYLETGNRHAFENGGAPVLLHPDFAQTMREQTSCAPFAEAGAAVEAVRQHILDRANIATTTNPALNITYEQGAAIIKSRSAIPGEIFADPRDQRRLGVKIASLRIGRRKIPLDHPALMEGWHDPEPGGRWTNGSAVIPPNLLGRAKSIELELAATLAYPCRDEPLRKPFWRSQIM